MEYIFRQLTSTILIIISNFLRSILHFWLYSMTTNPIHNFHQVYLSLHQKMPLLSVFNWSFNKHCSLTILLNYNHSILILIQSLKFLYQRCRVQFDSTIRFLLELKNNFMKNQISLLQKTFIYWDRLS